MCIYDVTSDGVCHTNLKKKKKNGTRGQWATTLA